MTSIVSAIRTRSKFSADVLHVTRFNDKLFKTLKLIYSNTKIASHGQLNLNSGENINFESERSEKVTECKQR